MNNAFVRFLLWVGKLPFRIFYQVILGLYWVLSKILPDRTKSRRVIWYQFIVLGWVLAGFFFRQQYAIRCGYNYQVHGWFTTKQDCDDQYKNWMASLQTAQDPVDAHIEQVLANNPDMR